MNKNRIFVVDVESDGPCPGLYSMVCFGVCLVEPTFSNTFYGQTAPISTNFIPEALAISGFSREQHIKFADSAETMKKFADWLSSFDGAKIFISDNPAFDWQFINYYFHAYYGSNPFGFSGRRIGDIYAGLAKNFWMANKWKYLRKTPHTHNPVDDAKGNAEALIEFTKLGLKL